MNPGKLRHKLELQQNTAQGTYNDDGPLSESWSTVATVWGKIEPIGGNQRKVVIRYTSDIDEQYRLLFGTRALHIENIRLVDEIQHVMELDCREEVRDGVS